MTRAVDPASGQLRESTLSLAGQVQQRLDYSGYDVFGNLTHYRVDNTFGSSLFSSTETFSYDALQRLIRSERNTDNGSVAFTHPVITYGYDAVGNLHSKSDYASDYDYSGGGSGGPNAVKRITKIDGSQATFSYDANGNRLGGDGRTLTYNAFNKPLTITAGNARLQFHYGADQQRYRQSKTVDGHSETSVYIGRAFEQVTRGARRESRHYLGDFAVLTITAIGEAREYDIAYLHRDRLGGMTATVNSAGQVTGTYGYAPFGQPRDGQLVAQAGLGSRQTTRGFTGHEHLDAVALIHMNGRVYDYRLGQFLSVDPIIHNPADSQSLNPYAYLMNSPLAGTDPTGYDIERRRPGFMEDEEEDPHAELVAQLRTLVRGKHNGAEADPGRQATVFAATDELLSDRVDERASEGARYGVGGSNVGSDILRGIGIGIFNIHGSATFNQPFITIANPLIPVLPGDPSLAAVLGADRFVSPFPEAANSEEQLGRDLAPAVAMAIAFISRNPSATKGIESGAWRLIGANNAKIDPRKLTEYALNPSHPVGGNKAKVFELALGFNKSNAGDLLKQIQAGVMNNTPIAGKVDKFGSRFTVDIPVTGPAGSATVRTGWIYKTGSDVPEMITLFVK